MKKTTLAEWEKKYIVGPVERFDPMYQMYIRPYWDPEIKDLLQNWSLAGTPKEKAGYTLEDEALRWGSVVNPRKPTSDEAQFRVYRPPEGAKTDTSDAEKTTRMIKKAARWFGADLVGICSLDKRWLYASESIQVSPQIQNVPDELQYVIVMAFEMDYDLISYYSTYAANAATRMGYTEMAITNAHLAAFIRNLGFQAVECGNDTGLSIPMAMQAGLGDIGRNGILITPEFGPRIRLSKVITDLPLVPDAPIDFGVTEMCNACGKCADNCPSRSIMFDNRSTEPHNRSNAAGQLKWRINAETCRTYWSRVDAPCVACIATCPYNKPSTWPHRTVRWLTDHARWADPLYVKGDDLFGYGKPRKADNFWDERQPRKGH